jgi:hypothetical protein
MTPPMRRVIWGSALLLLVLAAGAAEAQTSAEIACRNAMAKNLGKYVTVVFRDLATCHRKRSAGRLPLSTNCNDALGIPKTRSVKAYEKASAAMRAACPDSLTSVLAQYARCPSPHSNLDDDDATDGIDSFQEATSCVLSLATTLANGAAATVLGRPATVPSARAARCQRALGRGLRKRIDTFAKVRRVCQLEADRGGGGISYACAHFDDGRLASNLNDLGEDIVAACAVPQEDLVPLGACGQTPEQLVRCAGGISTVLGGGLVAQAYELPSTCKLGFSLLAVNAGNGAMRTSTRFQLGYSGLGLGTDLLDDFRLATNLDCNPDCVDCTMSLNPLKPSPSSYCRCDSDPTIHCDTIDGADADDCGGGHCTCMFGPPLPLSTGGVGACVINGFSSDLVGTADGGTGLATTTLSTTSKVFLGISAIRPCPVCSGDPTANDGSRGGMCQGGARDGQACDQNALSPDFGPLSYECQPSPMENVSGSGLELTYPLTSVEAPTIGANLSDNGSPVFCLQCSGNPQVACSSDAECAERGIGTCTANTASQARANACDDGICTASDPNRNGVCAANAADRFCDGLTRNDGSGLLTCLQNADCDTLDPYCPGGSCGNCSLTQPRACFPNPFGAAGSDAVVGAVPSSGVYGADMVGTLCVPASGSSTIDDSVGLPGPARLLINFDFLGRCAGDPSTSFDLPGGSNCP